MRAVVVGVCLGLASTLDVLGLLLGRNHSVAVPAAHQASKGKGPGFRSWLTLITQQLLYAIKLFKGNHCPMRPVGNLVFVVDLASVKDIVKHSINTAHGQWCSAALFGLSCPK